MPDAARVPTPVAPVNPPRRHLGLAIGIQVDGSHRKRGSAWGVRPCYTLMPKILFIGGLVAVGFDAAGKFLLTVSHSGRGVFSTATWERVARDATVVYPDAGMISGIGPLDGVSVPVKEVDYDTGVLRFTSPDGKLCFMYEEGAIEICETTA